ncbi:MAG TPA: iron ABC transporter permease [Candidatus Corynebacterium gallistercoris]|uniref:Iron ABC transporter permease n=1 Tax=Candidatus Corynebacterium gallistercoris TaxID=2838530 RepID=A0A9D1RY25_9CORY|nr:iron ABC transporter permease [Candidatus Corynebacterium gallistercoris]
MSSADLHNPHAPQTAHHERPTNGPSVVLFALSALVGASTVVPFILLITQSISGGWEKFETFLFRPRTVELFINSVLLTVTVSACCLVLGVVLAWIIATFRLPGKRWLIVLSCLPLAVPSYIGTLALLSAFPHLTGFVPLVIAMTLTSVPLVTIPVLGALALTNRDITDAARTLGASTFSAFLRTTVPQILPAAMSGVLLVALYVLSDFGAPAMMRFETLTTGVYMVFSSSFNRANATVMSLPLAALALAVVVLERRVRKTSKYHQAGMTQANQSRRSPIDVSRGAQLALSGVVIAISGSAIIFPLASLLWRMKEGTRYLSETSRIVEASVSSLSIAVIAATIATLAAMPISYLAAHHRSRAVAVVEGAHFVGNALPSVVVALALVSTMLTLFKGSYQTMGVLLAAYVVLYISKTIGSSRSAIALVPLATQDAARTLGRGPIATACEVTLRGSLPGIAAGWLLVAIAVMKELPVTLMLRPIGLNTLATELWSKTSLGAYASAAPIGVLLVLIGIVPAWWMSKNVITHVS